MTVGNSFFLHAFELGAALCFLYDLFRLSRRIIPRKLFWVTLEDLVFWCICAKQVFLLLHRESYGMLRWYAVLAASMGIWGYLRFISPLFLKVSLHILTPPVVFLKKLLTHLLKLLKMIGKEVKKIGRKIRLFAKNKARKKRSKQPEEGCLQKDPAE